MTILLLLVDSMEDANRVILVTVSFFCGGCSFLFLFYPLWESFKADYLYHKYEPDYLKRDCTVLYSRIQDNSKLAQYRSEWGVTYGSEETPFEQVKEHLDAALKLLEPHLSGPLFRKM